MSDDPMKPPSFGEIMKRSIIRRAVAQAVVLLPAATRARDRQVAHDVAYLAATLAIEQFETSHKGELAMLYAWHKLRDRDLLQAPPHLVSCLLRARCN